MTEKHATVVLRTSKFNTRPTCSYFLGQILKNWVTLQAWILISPVNTSDTELSHKIVLLCTDVGLVTVNH